MNLASLTNLLTADRAAQGLFLVYLAVILAGGGMAVFSRNLIRAMLGLILTLFGVSGMYLLMNAPFIALMQLLIYVGAVSVLIFFAIMLTRGLDEDTRPGAGKVLLALAAAAMPAAVLGGMLARHGKWPVAAPAVVPLHVLGDLLLTDYVLAFEAISVVLFVAMAGAVILGFERRLSR